ncbi:MAG: hypothetical protein QNK04_13145 [Myxococcota bacterium]|nr:hypothetical protein [Myxococcota bacterium]
MSDPKTPQVDVGSMMDGMRGQLESDEADGRLAGLTVDRLEKAVSHPEAKAVISELMAREPAVVGQGDRAPDFTLPWLSGSHPGDRDTMTLSDHFGKRPVALVFGSYT